MTKEELEKYAHENRKRLDAQGVKIGDVVKVLRWQFAGETGVVVGIIACIGDYTDPYYEVDMDCEVPDKYKCRKNTLAPNNVIGGLTAYEFEVIGNRTHTEPTAPTIKVGDIVRCKTPLRLKSFTDDDFIGTVTDAENGWFIVHMNNGAIFQSYNAADLELVQPKEQTEAEKKPNVGSIKIPVEVDLSDGYWDAYTADLAKEIAVKSMEKSYGCDPERIADYAVSVAKAVVENLKKK